MVLQVGQLAGQVLQGVEGQGADGGAFQRDRGAAVIAGRVADAVQANDFTRQVEAGHLLLAGGRAAAGLDGA